MKNPMPTAAEAPPGAQAAEKNRGVPTPHRPSKLQATAFFVFSLFVAAGVIAWVFFVNFGTLVFEGEMPFRVSVGTQDISCAKVPCATKFKPGSYAVTFKKDGFFDATQMVKVRRWNEVSVRAEFTFIPVIREIGEVILPFVDAPLLSPFLGKKRLENFPKDAKKVVFSGSGTLALVTLGREVYVYDMEKKSVSDPELLASAMPTWMDNRIAALKRDEEKDTLVIAQDEGFAPIAAFEKPFTSPKLFGAPEGNFVLIEDEIGPNHRVYYLVDAAKKSRKRLHVDSAAVFHGWVGGYLFFGAQTAGGASVFLLPPIALKEIYVPAATAENVIEGGDGKILFLAGQKEDSGKPKLGVPISEILEETVKETVEAGKNAPKKGQTLFITEYDIEKNAFRTLTSVMVEEGEKIERLTADAKSGRLYFLKGGRVWEVVLTK